MHLAQVKKSSALCHTRFLSLVAERWVPGSVNIHWTDPAVFTQPDQWIGFLSAMVTAHEADLLYISNFLEEITKNKYNQAGLTLKDFKPDTFESNETSKLSIRQWSDEFSSWVERIDQDFETMLRLAAQMQMCRVFLRYGGREKLGRIQVRSMHVDLHQGCDLERSRTHAIINAPQVQIHHMEAVNLVCDDALDDHVWENERTISCQEAKVLEVLGYDVAVPCVVQWRMLWFSSPTSVNRRFLNSGMIIEKCMEVIDLAIVTTFTVLSVL